MFKNKTNCVGKIQNFYITLLVVKEILLYLFLHCMFAIFSESEQFLLINW